MKKLGKLATALLTVATCVFAHNIAKADTLVSYSTTGFFSGNTPSLMVGGDTISFTGTTGNVSAPTFANMGSFATTALSSQSFNGYSFTLEITEITPPSSTSSPQSVTAELTGTLKTNGSFLTVDFQGQTANFDIPSLNETLTFYPSTPSSFGVSAPTSINPNTSTSLQGSIDVSSNQTVPTPLPKSGLAGFGLLGALFIGTVRKHRALI